MSGLQTHIVGLGISSSLGPNLNIFAENLADNVRFFEREEMMIGYDGREQVLALRFPYPAERNPVERLKLLFDEAFKDFASNTPEVFFEQPVAGFLALPKWVGKDKELLDSLREVFWKTFPPGIKSLYVMFEDHVCADKVLHTAFQKLQQGKLTRAVIVAADTHATPKVLDDPFFIERIIQNDNPYGFIPGEAAVAVALDQSIKSDTSWGTLQYIDHEKEEERPGDLDGGIMGFGMRTLFRRCHDVLAKGKSFDLVAGDMNGQRYRAEEYGFSVTGQTAPSDAFILPFLHTLNIGDVGAASGLMSLLCTLISDLNEGSSILTWSSSERSGQRYAKVLQRGTRRLDNIHLNLRENDE